MKPATRDRLVTIGVCAAMACLFLWLFLGLAGCSVGFTEPNAAGKREAVIGLTAGQIEDATASAASAIGDNLGELLGLGAGILGPIGVLGLGWARSYAKARAERAASEAHDEAWDESQRSAAASYAARDAAFDEAAARTLGAGVPPAVRVEAAS